MVGTLLYLQMYERMYAYDRSPLDANIESEERELTLLAQAVHYFQSRICQRARYRPTDRNALNQRLRLRSDSFQLTSLSRQNPD